MERLPSVPVSSVRRHIIIGLIFITPAGLLFKFYPGPGHAWFNNYGAGLLYEVFWILVFFFIFPGKRSANRIPLWVFLATSALESIQLYHFPFLQKIRSCFLGKALIGTTFVWADFPHYAVGCITGWLYLKWAIKKVRSDH